MAKPHSNSGGQSREELEYVRAVFLRQRELARMTGLNGLLSWCIYWDLNKPVDWADESWPQPLHEQKGLRMLPPLQPDD